MSALSEPPPVVILVTGGGSGIGRAVALLLARSGATVAVAGRRVAALEETQTLADGEVECHQLDVRSTASVDGAVAEILGRHGRLDGVVNAAGVAAITPSAELTDAQFEEVIDVNLMGAMRISRAAARPMLSARRGSIVHIASLTAHAALPGRLAYTCSKHGVLGLVRTLATEWAPLGVRVNAVTPGWVGTDMTASGLVSGRLDGSLIERQTPTGRWATPEDVAGAAAFLLGAAANFVNGAEIVVDGGWSAAVRADPMEPQLPPWR